ncbi:MAG: NAD(P)H-binding protein [Anaerolineae bacterium]|nr:NAD(P)H-binding protein [Anaerolineae bacterium]
MIMVTGATGFVGNRLVRRLVNVSGNPVRVYLRMGSDLERLPRGAKIHLVMGSLFDQDALEAAMQGVHTVYHLAGTDTRGRHAKLQEVDVRGTSAVVEAALNARVGRLICLSRVGAARSSAFPTLRTKGEIEEIIRSSGLAYTIFQTNALFGENDRFSEHIAMLVQSFPFYFVPGEGSQVLQPLWVEDLVTCMTMALQDLDMIDRTIALGGPELLSYRRIVMRVMYAIGKQRPIIGVPLLAHRVVAWYLDGLFARWPITEQWTEMLSTHQTAELGAIERNFGFRPRVFDMGLIDTYLKDRPFRSEMLQYIFSGQW